MLREALDLWRGEPLTGLSGEWVSRMRDSWERQRLDAVTAWADAETAVGNHAVVIGRLPELIGEHPLVEPLVAVLMRALYEAGRGAEALECFAEVRKRLAGELGADPGTELRQIHRAILYRPSAAGRGSWPGSTRSSRRASAAPHRRDPSCSAGRPERGGHPRRTRRTGLGRRPGPVRRLGRSAPVQKPQ